MFNTQLSRKNGAGLYSLLISLVQMLFHYGQFQPSVRQSQCKLALAHLPTREPAGFIYFYYNYNFYFYFYFLVEPAGFRKTHS